MLTQNAVRAFFLFSLSLLHFSLGAAGRELAPPPIAQTSYYTSGVATAYAGERFLTLWRENMYELGVVTRGAFSDADGRRVSEQSFPVGVSSHGNWIQLVGAGDRYVLFHIDYRLTGGPTPYMTEIDLQGRILAQRVADLAPHTLQRIAWNGVNFVAAAIQPGRDYVDIHLLDREGRSLRDPLAMNSGSFGIDITAIGSSFLVAAAGPNGLFAHGVRRDGTFDTHLIESFFNTPSSQTRLSGVALADTPNGALAVWGVHTRSGSYLRAQLLESAGEPVEMPQILFQAPGTLTPLDLMHTDDGFVLTFRHHSAPAAEPTLHSMFITNRGFRLGDVRTITPIEPSEVASDDNGRVIFTAWQPSFTIPRYVAGVAVGTDAEVKHEELLSISPKRQLQPALTAVGGRFLAAWSELGGNERLVRSASVAIDGEPVSVVNSRSPRLLASRELASSGDTALLLETTGSALLATRVALDGTPLHTAPHVLGSMSPHFPGAAAVWVRDRWLVAWPEGSEKATELRVATITATGDVTPAQTLTLDTPIDPHRERIYQFASLGTDGPNALLVWSERHRPFCMMPICDDGPLHTFAIRLTREGAMLDAPLKLFEGNLHGTSIASSGREFFVTLDSTARILDARDGMLRVASSQELFTWPAATDVTWDGREYVVAMRYRGLNWYLATRRFGRTGSEIGTIRGTRTLAADEFAPPSVASVLANESLIAVQEGDTVDGVRAASYRERDLGALPAPPQSPQNVRVQPLAFLVEITWDPSPGPEPEVYVVERKEGDEWIEIARVTPDQRRLLTEPGLLRVRAFNAGGGSPETEAVPPSRPLRRRSIGR